MIRFLLLLVIAFPAVVHSEDLNQKLEQVKQQKLSIERALIEAEKTKKSTENQLTRLKSLQKLQAQEKELTAKRLRDLEKYMNQLRERKEEVQKKIAQSQGLLRVKFSKLIHPMIAQHDKLLRGDQGAGEKRIQEEILSSVVLAELKELETLHADLQDVEELEGRIEQEKQQIASLLQDISEQESLIQFHQRLRQNLTAEKHIEHMKQLEDYKKIKVAETEIEKMILQFQDRKKMVEAMDEKKRMVLVKMRPKSLPWPMKGKVVSNYGQQKDPITGLNIFKKGIEIQTISGTSYVHAVSEGVVQYTGAVPGKGNVMIIEHPGLIYSVYGGLQDVMRGVNQEVKPSDILGTVPSETSLYFEIRVRNVAIDPVKWLQ